MERELWCTFSIVALKEGKYLKSHLLLGGIYITVNLLSQNCMLPENYMHLLALHENKHLSKISTILAANFNERH